MQRTAVVLAKAAGLQTQAARRSIIALFFLLVEFGGVSGGAPCLFSINGVVLGIFNHWKCWNEPRAALFLR
jgi:hypothetical protein